VEGCVEQRAGIGEDLAKIALSACNLDLRLRFVRVGLQISTTILGELLLK